MAENENEVAQEEAKEEEEPVTEEIPAAIDLIEDKIDLTEDEEDEDKVVKKDEEKMNVFENTLSHPDVPDDKGML